MESRYKKFTICFKPTHPPKNNLDFSGALKIKTKKLSWTKTVFKNANKTKQ